MLKHVVMIQLKETCNPDTCCELLKGLRQQLEKLLVDQDGVMIIK